MKKIAMLYICTGKYEMFWDEYYRSSKEHFYPDAEKEYFVFTDSKRIIECKLPGVHTYYQAKSGWPYDTLLRYQWFCTVQDALTEFDYCYYVNANSVFLRDVTEALIPYPTAETPLVLSLHPRYYNDLDGSACSPERRPESRAYVAPGTPCRAHCGAFWGGTREAVLEMCRVLRDRTAQDLADGVIAVWHDQSHLIKYATEVPHLNIAQYLVSYEEYADPDKCLLMFPAKSKYGGNDKLREISGAEHVKHLPKQVYAKVLRGAKKLHLDGALKRAARLVKK